MDKILFCAGMAFLVALSPVSAADVEVFVNPEALAEIESVLLVPLGCGTDRKCRKLEDSIAQAVRAELGAEVVPREEVHRTIERIGFTRLTRHMVDLLARAVDADACLWVRSRHIDPVVSTSVVIGSVAVGIPIKLSSVRLELVSTRGTTLIEGRSKAYNRGLLRHVRSILKKATRESRDGDFTPGRHR